PGFRYETTLVGHGERVGATFHGDVFLVGSGDPTLTDSQLAVLAHRLAASGRSEEHTSELQSLTNLVCRLLLEKKHTPPHEPPPPLSPFSSFFYARAAPRLLPSFPTRRSSDPPGLPLRDDARRPWRTRRCDVPRRRLPRRLGRSDPDGLPTRRARTPPRGVG